MAKFNLTDCSDAELVAEVKRREEERARLAAEALRKRQEVALKNVPALLALVPNHECTSCSDDNPQNSGDYRCTRCFLLEMQNLGYWFDGADLEIRVIPA